MTTPRIRVAGPEDAPGLAELSARTFDETFRVFNREEDIDSYMSEAFSVAQQSRELADSRTDVFLAIVDETAVGYAKLVEGPHPECVTGERPIELARMYALRSWHGRGIAAALMEACLERASAGGFQTLWLGVWEHNPRALGFYRKWGFAECGSKIFVLGTDPQTDLVMSRPL